MFTSGSLILASDYNDFHATITSLYNTGATPANGYQQGNLPFSTRTAGRDLIASTDWRNLTGILKKFCLHQGVSFATIPLDTDFEVGVDRVFAAADIPAIITTIAQPNNYYSADPADMATAALRVHQIDKSWLTSATIQVDYTFNTVENAAKFFNTGGELQVAGSHVTGTSTDNAWRDILLNKVGTFRLGANRSWATGTAGSVAPPAGPSTSKGYYQLTTGFQTLFSPINFQYNNSVNIAASKSADGRTVSLRVIVSNMARNSLSTAQATVSAGMSFSFNALYLTGTLSTFTLFDLNNITTVVNPSTNVGMLTSISISGPGSVNENSTASYICHAVFSDGPTVPVTPIWNLAYNPDKASASVSAVGVISVGVVNQQDNAVLTATYSIGGVQKQAQKGVLIVDSIFIQSVTISGPSSAFENTTVVYTATARLNTNAIAVGATFSWTVVNTQGAPIVVTPSGANLTIKCNAFPSRDYVIEVKVTATYQMQSVNATKIVTLRDQPQIVGVLVTGPNSMDEGTTAQFNAVVQYDNNSTANVTASSFWQSSQNAPGATLSQTGSYFSGQIDVPFVEPTIYASFGGKQGMKLVRVNNTGGAGPGPALPGPVYYDVFAYATGYNVWSSTGSFTIPNLNLPLCISGIDVFRKIYVAGKNALHNRDYVLGFRLKVTPVPFAVFGMYMGNVQAAPTMAFGPTGRDERGIDSGSLFSTWAGNAFMVGLSFNFFSGGTGDNSNYDKEYVGFNVTPHVANIFTAGNALINPAVGAPLGWNTSQSVTFNGNSAGVRSGMIHITPPYSAQGMTFAERWYEADDDSATVNSQTTTVGLAPAIRSF